MKKIELTVEEIEHSAIPGELLPMRPAHLDCIHRNINRLIAKKQSDCSQVEWFKLSDKRPMNGDWVIWVNETDRRTQLVLYISGTESPIADHIYWTPCPTPPEFDSPCVKELKGLFESDKNPFRDTRSEKAIIEIVKRHEKKEKE